MKSLKQKQLNSLLSELQNEGEYVFLDTARSDSENKNSFLFLKPQDRLDFFPGDDPFIFAAELEKVIAKGLYLAGWMSYEFGYLLEPQLAELLPLQLAAGNPLVSLGVFQEPYRYNHENGITDFPFRTSGRELTEFCAENIQLSQKKERYLQAIHRIREYIAAGDTYQVNYTLKLLFDFSGSPEAFYRALRRNQSVAYGAMMHLGSEHILSLSPELFFRIDPHSILVRPMKGTMKRGRDMKEDLENCETLQRDIKNRSENVMIVDLLRNDLARLTHQFGDAKVVTRSLFDVERYESVLQMTSTIYAETKDSVLKSVGMYDILKALFPCGSVTGAPKIRTMEIVRELEEFPRGIYTGAIGYFAPDGTAAFNVPIRTIRLSGSKGEMGIGSGIVHDSDPEQEWQECLLKAHFLTKPVPEFVLIETFLLVPDKGFWLLDEHLERLEKSAKYFCFNFSVKEVLASLHILETEETVENQCHRVRLTLAKDGTVKTTFQPCDPPAIRSLPEKPQASLVSLPCVGLSEKRVESSLPWFFHKTSRRDLFQEEFAEATAHSLFDMIFLNEREEVTEGCISNLVVFLDGRYYTPPVSSGLLAGTMRARLLAEPVSVQEKVLTLDDLHQATALFCCNSVRGLVQVLLVES
ncbi:MAG TPA: aminodeoxychorismate synthase component I [Desulfocapsa sulfexigens]|nr:aminodeoxychorismate synthase component I [Desulfocapsa sulfexigens]